MNELDEIINLIINGHRKLALKYLDESPYDMEELYEELINKNMSKEIIAMHRIAVSQGYITFNPANLSSIK